MKKIAFALQVFTLILILPLSVFIEMNRTSAVPTENNIVEEVSSNSKITSTNFSPIQKSKLKLSRS
jgi:hypothetical protein